MDILLEIAEKDKREDSRIRFFTVAVKSEITSSYPAVPYDSELFRANTDIFGEEELVFMERGRFLSVFVVVMRLLERIDV